MATIDSPSPEADAERHAARALWSLGGANTYSGGTDIEGNATVQALQPLGVWVKAASRSMVRLDLNGQSITVKLLRSNTYDGLITNDSTTASALTVDQDSNAAYYGDIQDGNGSVCLVLAGNGVLVVEGDNSYSGSTTVSSGLFVIDKRRRTAQRDSPDGWGRGNVDLRPGSKPIFVLRSG